MELDRSETNFEVLTFFQSMGGLWKVSSLALHTVLIVTCFIFCTKVGFNQNVTYQMLSEENHYAWL